MRHTARKNLVSPALAAGLAVACALPAHAARNPVEIGAQSGAMAYCRSKAKSDNERARYNVLLTNYMQDMQKLSPAEANQAMVMQQMTVNQAAYHGKKLDRNYCGKLYEQFTYRQIRENNNRP